jgi:hypothetical protein
MKLLYHNPSHEGGLCEYAVHQAHALLAVENVQLFWQAPTNVKCPEGSYALPALPSPVFRSGRSRWRRAWDFLCWILATNRALDLAIAELRPDAVLLPSWSEYFAPLWAWRLRRWRCRGVRFGAIIHDPVRNYKRGGKAFHQLSLSQAYSFLDVAFIHEFIELDTGGAPRPKIVVVPMGPYPVAEGDLNNTSIRDFLGIPQGARAMLSFGHIRDGKCLDAVLEAMVTTPNCHLIVAGREQSGGQKPAAYYQHLARRLGVADRCHWFLGYIPNDQVWRYFCAADRLLLLYSQDFYSMSAVLNVNVQFRLPVIASGGGGPLLNAVQTYGLGQILADTSPGCIAKAFVDNHLPVARWDDYLRDHSWETNAEVVVEALSA